MSRTALSPIEVDDAFEFTDDMVNRPQFEPKEIPRWSHPNEVNPTARPGETTIILGGGPWIKDDPSIPYVTVVDDEVFKTLMDEGYKNWTACAVGNGRIYAGRNGKRSEGPLFKKRIYLHRYVAGALKEPSTVLIDHMDGNSLRNVGE
ncbi:MAG: hypothetical protein QF858_03710 [Candidatus Pacebacteria bacterium]|jgi:hypothetical protein|nr:hypothetical protein [bacterium]MDP6527950.1 hypothetical protein [Candidatus Paceibacterota bacterium]MDP6659480.1 hypothetical protein [Candidatus Paceibacterota bacterium]|tara:strand:+ start:10756 stop:11199 length:444 start_codon:yes stop_codon:yes gene_type:complete